MPSPSAAPLRGEKDPTKGTRWLFPADTEHTRPCWVTEGRQGPEGDSGKGIPCKEDSPTAQKWIEMQNPSSLPSFEPEQLKR